MIGPGKYDQECEAALLATEAHAVLLIVLGGSKGNGFSFSMVQTGPLPDTRAIDSIPQMLRSVANQIEADAKKLPNS